MAGQGGALRLYVSDETHSSQRKAAQLLGFGDANVRSIPTDDDGRLDTSALAAALTADRSTGLVPCCVVASAGTVSTGAIDDLSTVADLCGQHDAWLHIDASLGGFGILDPSVSSRFVGLDRADSIAVDPHKWLAVPVDCAAVLVRHLDDLRKTFSLVPAYLRGGADDEPWFSEYVFDQTRPFRALKLWATLVTAGRAELTRRITSCIGLAATFEAAVEASGRFALAATRDLQVVVFRPTSVEGDSSDHDDDERIVRALERVRRSSTVFLTGTRVQGREAMRACFLNHETSLADMAAILPAIAAALDADGVQTPAGAG